MRKGKVCSLPSAKNYNNSMEGVRGLWLVDADRHSERLLKDKQNHNLYKRERDYAKKKGVTSEKSIIWGGEFI